MSKDYQGYLYRGGTDGLAPRTETILVEPATLGGVKFDQGKTRIELFPGDVLFAISEILTFGAEKYAARNWEKGMAWGRCFGALMRHLWSWWQGKGPTNENFLFGSLDPETKRSHLWHAGCMLTFLIAYEMREAGEDDRPGSRLFPAGQWDNCKFEAKSGELRVVS